MCYGECLCCASRLHLVRSTAGLKWHVAFGPARHREPSTNFTFTPSLSSRALLSPRRIKCMESEKNVSHHKNSIADSCKFQQYKYCVITLRAYIPVSRQTVKVGIKLIVGSSQNSTSTPFIKNLKDRILRSALLYYSCFSSYLFATL